MVDVNDRVRKRPRPSWICISLEDKLKIMECETPILKPVPAISDNSGICQLTSILAH